MSPCDKVKLCLLILFCQIYFFQSNTSAQVNSTDTVENINSYSKVLEKFNSRSSRWAESLCQKILMESQAQLAKLHEIENSIAREVNRVNNPNSDRLIESIQIEYAKFQQKIGMNLPADMPYLPMLDSISGIMGFQKFEFGNKVELLKLETQLVTLKENLSVSEFLKIFSEERQSFLKDLLEKSGNIPSKLKSKYLGEYSKQMAIFKGRSVEWRKEINDPSKYEKLALLALNKLPAFKSYMQENGELSRLFGNPSSAMSGIGGLQTRLSLMQSMQQKGFTPGNIPSLLQPQIQSAQLEFNKVKEKYTNQEPGEISNGNSDIAGTPTHNTRKTKPFSKRLEYGIDFQSGIRRYQFPSSNAIAISAAYKITERFITGFGFEYKFSFGENLQHMHYSSDGIGFRSFIDYKITNPLKGVKLLFSNIWLSGGYEKSYWLKYKSFPELKPLLWTESGLIGLSKKISQRNRQLKTQVFWNFLAGKTGSTPVFFRFGFNM